MKIGPMKLTSSERKRVLKKKEKKKKHVSPSGLKSEYEPRGGERKTD